MFVFCKSEENRLQTNASNGVYAWTPNHCIDEVDSSIVWDLMDDFEC